jgi:hypothetical protein
VNLSQYAFINSTFFRVLSGKMLPLPTFTSHGLLLAFKAKFWGGKKIVSGTAMLMDTLYLERKV